MTLLLERGDIPGFKVGREVVTHEKRGGAWVRGHRVSGLVQQQILYNKLSAEVRKAILDDQRETLSIVELNELIEAKAKGGKVDERAFSYIMCPKCGSTELTKHAIEWTVYDPEGPREEPGHVVMCKCGWVGGDSLPHEVNPHPTANEA